jgi:pimeloyl-ACP methyl ester carboxylesterase
VVQRAFLLVLTLLLNACAFTQMREGMGEYYANPAGFSEEPVREGRMEVTSLEHFAEGYGAVGLWQPLSFVRERRGGVYLLEPYDPARIPVLFVHGAGGTPHDWRYFIEHLDPTKYQAWVYSYPTGLPVEVSAKWLGNAVERLHRKYRFERLVVGAHSMGGLVARRFIAGVEQQYETLLATFSTPWGGVPVARLGRTLGVYAVPSWRDLVPDSVLLRTLQAQTLPSSVKHHLFYGYRGSGDDWDSDGVITVRSQREPAIAASAAGAHGFRTDHSAILDDPAVFRRFAGVLDRFN